jgi:hypothetical protein
MSWRSHLHPKWEVFLGSKDFGIFYLNHTPSIHPRVVKQ